MLTSWIPKVLFPVIVALIFALFRRMAPPRAFEWRAIAMTSHRFLSRFQVE